MTFYKGHFFRDFSVQPHLKCHLWLVTNGFRNVTKNYYIPGNISGEPLEPRWISLSIDIVNRRYSKSCRPDMDDPSDSLRNAGIQSHRVLSIQTVCFATYLKRWNYLPSISPVPLGAARWSSWIKLQTYKCATWHMRVGLSGDYSSEFCTFENWNHLFSKGAHVK